jgi:hypothetical protein
LNKPITIYIPNFAGSDFDRADVLNALLHEAGMEFVKNTTTVRNPDHPAGRSNAMLVITREIVLQLFRNEYGSLSRNQEKKNSIRADCLIPLFIQKFDHTLRHRIGRRRILACDHAPVFHYKPLENASRLKYSTHCAHPIFQEKRNHLSHSSRPFFRVGKPINTSPG